MAAVITGLGTYIYTDSPPSQEYWSQYVRDRLTRSATLGRGDLLVRDVRVGKNDVNVRDYPSLGEDWRTQAGEIVGSLTAGQIIGEGLVRENSNWVDFLCDKVTIRPERIMQTGLRIPLIYTIKDGQVCTVARWFTSQS